MLEHELVHSRQFWNPRKWFIGKLAREVEAYREQLKWHPDRADIFATILSTRYGLNITKEEALKLLTA
jgi:predicted transcriptional regulator